MDRKYVTKHNVIDRYLRGELAPPEREEFEAFYLDDSETLDLLEASRAVSNLPGETTLSLQARHRYQPIWALAIVLAFLVGFFVSPPHDQSAPMLANIRIIELEVVRGLESAELLAPESDDYLIFRIAIGSSEELLKLIVTDDSDHQWEATGLSTDAFGDVMVGIPVSQLGQSTARLKLVGQESGEPRFDQEISFR